MRFGQVDNFAAVVTGLTGPIAYEWRWREPPDIWGPVVSTIQTHTHYMGKKDFELQVKVTRNGHEIYRTKHVTYNPGPGSGGCGGSIDVLINGPTTLARGQTGNFAADVPQNCCTRFEWRWRYVGNADWSVIVGGGRTYSHTMGTRDTD